MADRVSLQLGSATELPFEAGSFDKVIALESAFHFNTREDFFREAFRVLRSGGRIVLLDMIPLREFKGPFWKKWTLAIGQKIWQMNALNMYPRDVYAEKLRTAGFVRAEVQSIHEHVEPHFERYAVSQLATPEVKARFNPAVSFMFSPPGAKDPKAMPTGFEMDYVLAFADKP
jgi:ubiquinone/menaquinone biosynthesis C-methylase UbiE